MTDLYKQIGKNIKIARKAKGLSQKELSDKLTVSRSSLSNMEVGRHKVTIEQLVEISNFTGFKLSSLIEDKGQSMPRFTKHKVESIYNDYFGQGYWERQYKKVIISFVRKCMISK